MNRAATLDAANSKAGGIGKTADDTGLPLQRTLHGLEYEGWVPEVDDVDVSLGRAHHHQALRHIECVDPFLQFQRAHRGGRPQIPVLELLVPRTGHQHLARVRRLDEPHTLDGLLVGGYLGGLPRRDVE